MTKLLLLLFCAFTVVTSAQTVGLIYSNPGAADGYVLFSPSNSFKTFLIDKCGKQIHEWESVYGPGLAVYLLPDGSLLRCGDLDNPLFLGGGHGGIIEKFDWNGNLLWSYIISDTTQCQHHDAIQLPNGNVMAIAWEYHSQEDAAANGREDVGLKMWSEKIVEVQPVGTDSGVIVWEWRAWDHMIQEADATKLNYGVVADHPELIDINVGTLHPLQPDWLHFNSLSYNEELDQLMVGSHNLNEILIIDHSTTLAEVASHIGGNAGGGGDLMYRWGNPQNYGRGTEDDRKLFQQHYPHWTSSNEQVMVFNNGVGRPGTDYSTVETFKLPAMVNNNYPIDSGMAYLPLVQEWIYAADPVTALFSNVMGGAERLPNGNTLICNATSGNFLEVDLAGNSIWKYVNPIGITGSTTQGEQPALNACFRLNYYAPGYAGFNGQVLTPGEPLELSPLSYTCPTIISNVANVAGVESPVVFPNPFSNHFTLHIPGTLSQATLQIHDITGRLLYQENKMTTPPDADYAFDRQLPAGIVIISINDASQNIHWKTNAIVQ